MAEPRRRYRPAFGVRSRTDGAMRVELRKGRRSARRLLTPEEVDLLMFMLATVLADFDQGRAPEAAELNSIATGRRSTVDRSLRACFKHACVNLDCRQCGVTHLTHYMFGTAWVILLLPVTEVDIGLVNQEACNQTDLRTKNTQTICDVNKVLPTSFIFLRFRVKKYSFDFVAMFKNKVVSGAVCEIFMHMDFLMMLLAVVIGSCIGRAHDLMMETL